MVKLLARTLGKDIEIALDLAADPWPVLADAAQLNPRWSISRPTPATRCPRAAGC